MPTRERSFGAVKKAPEGSSTSQQSKSTPQVRRTQRRFILVVDDEPSILSIRRLVLETRGYSVLTAASGREALEIMERAPVDLVVLDYRMPEMDGEATAIEIRRLHGDVPIILSTGCVSLSHRLLELVNVSVHKGSGPKILIDAIEQRIQAEPIRLSERRPSLRTIGNVTALWRGLYSFTRS